MKRILITAALLLAIPANAQANPDVGKSFCGTVGEKGHPPKPGCFTIEASDLLKDTFVQGPYSGYVDPKTGQVGSNNPATCNSYPPSIPYTCVKTDFYTIVHYYNRSHAWREEPWRVMGVVWNSIDGYQRLPINLVGGDATDMSYLNTPDCGNVNPGRFLRAYTYEHHDSKLYAKEDAPQGYVDACGLERWAGEDAGGSNPVEGPVTTDAKLQSCKAFKHGKKNVRVTSRGVACGDARNMLAKYVKRGVEPEGYTCLRLKLGKTRAAKCVKSSKGKAKPIELEGRWR
jgi:hypothetical protein